MVRYGKVFILRPFSGCCGQWLGWVWKRRWGHKGFRKSDSRFARYHTIYSDWANEDKR